MLQTIMISTMCTGRPRRWNNIAPQMAENAKPATLDTDAAAKMASITHRDRL
jgi:hypothetical protein